MSYCGKIIAKCVTSVTPWWADRFKGETLHGGEKVLNHFMSYHITTIVLCQKYHVDWCYMADAIHIKYAFCFKFQWGTPSSSINFNSSRCHPGVRTLDRDVTFSCVSFPVMKYQIQCSSGGKIEIYVFASMHYVVFLTLNIIFSSTYRSVSLIRNTHDNMLLGILSKSWTHKHINNAKV